MKEKKPKRRVGISGLKMDNSSISHTKIDGNNSDADVGIFDAEMIDAEITGLDIKDGKNSETTSKAMKKSLVNRLFHNPYAVSVAALIAVLSGIAELSGYSIRDFFIEKETTEQATQPPPPALSISTSGDNSPAIITEDGDVNINFGETKPKNDTIKLPKKSQ